ncbi:Copper amine oxidase-like, N-terminal [Fimbriimonadaceae bacterium]
MKVLKNDMKKFGIHAVVMLLAGAVSASSFAQNVYYNRDRVTFSGDERAFVESNVIFVPFRAMSDRIGARFERSDSGATIRVTWRNKAGTYRKGTNEMILDGRVNKINRPARERNDVLFIPVRFFELLTGGAVSYRNNGFNDNDNDGGLFGGNGGSNNGGTSVYFNGRPLSFSGNERPYRSNGTVQVPFRAMGDRLGYNTDRSSDGRTISVWKEYDRVEYIKGANYFRLNDERRSLRTSSQERDGVLFVPIEIFQALAGRNLSTSSNGSGGGLFGGGNNDDEYSNNTQEVYYDGRSLSFSGDERPIVKGSTLLVPARALASRIGASFERTEDGKRMWIRWRGREAQYDKGNIWFRINGERQSLSTISVERNEILFIPVKVFQALTENRIQVR